MKKTKRHIVSAWILLVCFFAGQAMVLAHQHKANSNIVKSLHAQDDSRTSFKEKCEMCDAMHHNVMLITSTYYAPHLVSVPYHYIDVTYKFISMSLVLSAGRSPPLS